MVYRIGKLLTLIRDTGIEDVFHALLQQPGHMSVGQLGRITFGFAGDGFNAQFVDLSGRGRGKDYLILQICKESIPVKKVYQKG